VISEGELAVEVIRSGDALSAVKLSSTRRTDVCRVLEGRPVNDGLTLVPLLFSLCGRAQTVAAVSAAEHALALTPDVKTCRLRHWVVLAEQAQEYLWRLLIDLPAAMDEPSSPTEIATLREQIAIASKAIQRGLGAQLPGQTLNQVGGELIVTVADQLRRCLESQVFGVTLEEWRSMASAPEFETWLSTGTTVVTRTLRHFASAGLPKQEAAMFSAAVAGDTLVDVVEKLLAADDFASLPVWKQGHPESGALARQWESPLMRALAAAGCERRVLRNAARLIELAAAPDQLRAVADLDTSAQVIGGGRLGSDVGYGWVETARGLLIHVLRLDRDRIATYRILAPTEWNFHPQGPLVNELMQYRIADDAEWERQARLAVLALDPCVGYKVCVSHA